ncbi:uncharacterized protein LOC110834528 isoform X2 [Zootermopsis nevadensis]|uniref:HAUS augmin-like complex subunit 8 n=1 Tax=Zootermopsis nevadensis TaxID=136037 RepID=A0A067R7S3_ZOONE|nr:uncharacterized protein LOC110834528 isoform X2 [Zootermopsis nevadensis]KDR14407.1 hypothetical protein L798_11710 [Zootermopsis nevadensis]
MKKHVRTSAAYKIKNNPTTKTQLKVTSTPKIPDAPLTQSHLSISNISCISTNASGSDSTSSKDVRKKVTVSFEDLEHAHNIYLLSVATTKLQEKTLSDVSAENENQKLALLSEVESKRDHLAALKKRCEEIKYLSQQRELLRREKEKLGPLMDFVTDGLKSMDKLKNALDCGLPVKGFQAEESACSLKNVLCENSKMLDKMCGATSEQEAVYSKTRQEISEIQNTVTSIAEAQIRCDTISTALSHAVLKESSLKVMKERYMKVDEM